jgi:cytoskeletal protein CcmA (bactofilin family)
MSEEKRDLGSLLGRGSEFKGKLTFMGTVRIEGVMDGEVLSDDTLVVAPGGVVRGTIDVGTLIVTGGVVEAQVNAKNAVELHPDSRLKGEVVSPVFQIERGAVFQGNCTMPDEAKEPDAEPDLTDLELTEIDT